MSELERMAEEDIESIERTARRYPLITSEAALSLISEIRQLKWELENAKKLVAYLKKRGGFDDGETVGLRVVATGG